MAEDEYIFSDVALEPELARLRSIEAVFDPATQRHLLTTGEWAGRRCLEVGAGAGSIAAWMGTHAGPSGRVVAVDTNVRFVESLRPAVEVVEGDVRELDLGASSFDVVHVRYVLIHNERADAIVEALLRALAPGGWLLVEEPDFSVAHSLVGPAHARAAFDRVNDAIAAMFLARGLDPGFGRRVPALLAERGLVIESLESDTLAARGGSPLAAMMRLSAQQLRDKYVSTGRATTDDVDGYTDFASDPATWGVYYSTVRVLARKS
jgi:SAM-dependent methyltransferase